MLTEMSETMAPLLPIICELRQAHQLRSAVTLRVSTDITPICGPNNRVDSVVASREPSIWQSGRMTGTRGTIDVPKKIVRATGLSRIWLMSL